MVRTRKRFYGEEVSQSSSNIVSATSRPKQFDQQERRSLKRRRIDMSLKLPKPKVSLRERVARLCAAADELDMPSHTGRNNRKRQRTDMPRHSRKHTMSLSEIKNYLADVELDPQEVERPKRMRSLRNIWNANREVFAKHLDNASLHCLFGKVDGWKRFTKHLHQELKLDIPITDETVQSCKDYAAELRELLQDCKKLDKCKLKSKANGIQEEFKDILKNIFDRKPLKLKKKQKHGASTSSGRKLSSSRNSYGGKSSRTDPSVHMPCVSWEDRVKVSAALVPIVTAWPTFLSEDILVNLCDHICSQPILCGAILNYDDKQKEQFITNYLERVNGL